MMLGVGNDARGRQHRVGVFGERFFWGSSGVLVAGARRFGGSVGSVFSGFPSPHLGFWLLFNAGNNRQP